MPTEEPALAFKLKVINKAEVTKNKNVNAIIDAFPKVNDISDSSTNLQGRSTYIEAYDFYVDDETVNYVTYGSYDSYTFAIHRSQDNGLVENLVLSKQVDGSYKASITSYNLSEAEKQAIKAGNTPLDIAQKTSVSSMMSRESVGEPCYEAQSITIISPSDFSASHTINIQAEVPCPTDDSNDGFWDDDGDTSGGGGGGVGGNPDTGSDPFGGLLGGGNGIGDGTGNPNQTDPNDPDTTDPDDTQDCLELDAEGNCMDDATAILITENNSTGADDPCFQLKRLTSPPAYSETNPYTQSSSPYNTNGKNTKPRLALINIDNELSSNWEHGFGFYNRGNYPKHGPYAQHIPSKNQKNVIFPQQPYQYGTVHTHPINDVAIPMFSAEDLYSLLSVRNYYTNNSLQEYNTAGDNLFVTALVVKQNGVTHTYAIKIEDISKLQSLQALWDDSKDSNNDGIDEWKDFSDKIDGMYSEGADNINSEGAVYQKIFLEIVRDLDLGIGLYEMEATGDQPPLPLEKWKKLTLNTNNQVAATPCN
ncbi:hypothetical protein H7F37_01335 [Winogradskyella sp. PAMC22761]|nr:hypothetical protein H7F37_01335 [Winogradskyella sp. PAMC22761]